MGHLHRADVVRHETRRFGEEAADGAGDDNAVESGVELPVAEAACRLMEALLQPWADRLDVLHAWAELDDAVAVPRRDHGAFDEARADQRRRPA